MINEENLNKLYEGIIEGKELTTKELNSYGFNSKDLATLINDGELERVKRGIYSFLPIDKLFQYGKSLISKKEYEKATESFKKCYELNPEHKSACFQLFLRSISDKDYISTFKYFEVLNDTNNQYYNADNNFYLYLLSLITEIPEKHRDYTRYLKIDDIRVDFNDKRYSDIQGQNKIRLAVLQRKLPYALKLLKDLINKRGNITLQDIVIKTLLLQAIEEDNQKKNSLLELAKNKKYVEIISFLELKEQNHNLSISDSYILLLAKAIVNINKTQNIPTQQTMEVDNLFDAIKTNNYEKALELNKKYNETNNINNEENIMNLLLSEICDIKKEIKKSKNSEVEFKNNKEINKSNNKTKNIVTFKDILNYLIEGNLEEAFICLRDYMIEIDKKDYEFLIIDLIKLSLLEKDIAFTKPMIALTYMVRENFKFDISTYIQNFYMSLSENKFDEARIYLDIITNSKKIDENSILTNGLEEMLNNIENISKCNKTTESLNKTEDALEQQEEPGIESVQNIQMKKEEIKQQQVPVSYVTRDSEKEFIRNKYELAKKQGIVLLKPMNNERRKRIHNIVKEYPDMVSFSIGENENRQIVLRYKPYCNEYIDVKSLISSGYLAYKNRKYDECIEKLTKLLQLNHPKAFVYARLGLSYMKIGNKELAIEYLTIATKLSKLENSEFEFTELIASLKGLIDKADKKPRFKMTVEEFDNKENFGIENLESITSHILETGLDVQTVCTEFQMSEEQYLIILLLYAREYYYQGNYEKGEEFLKVVERNNNKTKKVISIFNEIRTNKKFYINRNNDKVQKLSLTFKAQK